MLMFNKRLKQELSALRQELSSLMQVKESLDREMLALTLDADGRVQTANQNFLDEMHYKGQDLIGRSVEDLVPAYLKSNEFQLRFKTALTRGEHFRSEEHTSELQSLMRISYAVFCLKKKT